MSSTNCFSPGSTSVTEASLLLNFVLPNLPPILVYLCFVASIRPTDPSLVERISLSPSFLTVCARLGCMTFAWRPVCWETFQPRCLLDVKLPPIGILELPSLPFFAGSLRTFRNLSALPDLTGSGFTGRNGSCSRIHCTVL